MVQLVSSSSWDISGWILPSPREPDSHFRIKTIWQPACPPVIVAPCTGLAENWEKEGSLWKVPQVWVAVDEVKCSICPSPPSKASRVSQSWRIYFLSKKVWHKVVIFYACKQYEFNSTLPYINDQLNWQKNSYGILCVCSSSRILCGFHCGFTQIGINSIKKKNLNYKNRDF